MIKREGDTVWLLTNRHVVIDNETGQTGNNLEVEPYYGEDENLPKLPRARSDAKIVKTTPPKEPMDLAVLEVKGLPDDIQPLPLFLEKVDNNVAVLIVGHPDSDDWSEHNAILIGVQQSTGNYLLDVSLKVGASGSPILYQNRSVVGIMFKTTNSSETGDEGIGIGHPITAVQAVLNQWEVLN